MRLPIPPCIRVLAKTVERGECVIWTGAVDAKGYGHIGVGSRHDRTRRLALVHRVVWEATNGLVPAGLEIDHICRNRACVRLEHLRAVTHAENCARADHTARLEAIRARTHCKHGHPFDEANTHVSPDGHRECRACHAMWARIYRARRRSVA